MILKVARLGHPVLRQKAGDLDPAEIRAGRFEPLIEDMFETMQAYQGVGLAGPQVHLPFRIFVLELPELVARRRGSDPIARDAIFNASYEPASEDRVTDFEGCLSVPFLAGQCGRYSRIRVRGVDRSGQSFDRVVEGYGARIFQHEIDHTDGHV